MDKDDWRVSVTLTEQQHSNHIAQNLQEIKLEGDASATLGDRVTITREDNHLFLYCDSETAMLESEKIIRSLLAKSNFDGEITLARWHPAEEEWEDPSVPLPSTAAEIEAEHERLEQSEAEQAYATGVAEWEVELEFDRRHEAINAAKELQAKGLTVTRQWRYVFLGTANEDEAKTFAADLKDEFPGNVKINVALSAKHIVESVPSNPFAFLGGLGG